VTSGVSGSGVVVGLSRSSWEGVSVMSGDLLAAGCGRAA
jgi:hypothetical protein